MDHDARVCTNLSPLVPVLTPLCTCNARAVLQEQAVGAGYRPARSVFRTLRSNLPVSL